MPRKNKRRGGGAQEDAAADDAYLRRERERDAELLAEAARESLFDAELSQHHQDEACARAAYLRRQLEKEEQLERSANRQGRGRERRHGHGGARVAPTSDLRAYGGMRIVDDAPDEPVRATSPLGRVLNAVGFGAGVGSPPPGGAYRPISAAGSDTESGTDTDGGGAGGGRIQRAFRSAFSLPGGAGAAASGSGDEMVVLSDTGSGGGRRSGGEESEALTSESEAESPKKRGYGGHGAAGPPPGQQRGGLGMGNGYYGAPPGLKSALKKPSPAGKGKGKGSRALSSGRKQLDTRRKGSKGKVSFSSDSDGGALSGDSTHSSRPASPVSGPRLRWSPSIDQYEARYESGGAGSGRGECGHGSDSGSGSSCGGSSSSSSSDNDDDDDDEGDTDADVRNELAAAAAAAAAGGGKGSPLPGMAAARSPESPDGPGSSDGGLLSASEAEVSAPEGALGSMAVSDADADADSMSDASISSISSTSSAELAGATLAERMRAKAAKAARRAKRRAKRRRDKRRRGVGGSGADADSAGDRDRDRGRDRDRDARRARGHKDFVVRRLEPEEKEVLYRMRPDLKISTDWAQRYYSNPALDDEEDEDGDMSWLDSDDARARLCGPNAFGVSLQCSGFLAMALLFVLVVVLLCLLKWLVGSDGDTYANMMGPLEQRGGRGDAGVGGEGGRVSNFVSAHNNAHMHLRGGLNHPRSRDDYF